MTKTIFSSSLLLPIIKEIHWILFFPTHPIGYSICQQTLLDALLCLITFSLVSQCLPTTESPKYICQAETPLFFNYKMADFRAIDDEIADFVFNPTSANNIDSAWEDLKTAINLYLRLCRQEVEVQDGLQQKSVTTSNIFDC